MSHRLRVPHLPARGSERPHLRRARGLGAQPARLTVASFCPESVQVRRAYLFKYTQKCRIGFLKVYHSVRVCALARSTVFRVERRAAPRSGLRFRSRRHVAAWRPLPLFPLFSRWTRKGEINAVPVPVSLKPRGRAPPPRQTVVRASLRSERVP